jgi:hypothetical protein
MGSFYKLRPTSSPPDDIVESVLDLQRLQFIRSLLLNLAKESNHETA